MEGGGWRVEGGRCACVFGEEGRCREGGGGARLVLLERIEHALQRLARRARLHLLRLASFAHLTLHRTAHRRHLGGRLPPRHRLPLYRLRLRCHLHALRFDRRLPRRRRSLLFRRRRRLLRCRHQPGEQRHPLPHLRRIFCHLPRRRHLRLPQPSHLVVQQLPLRRGLGVDVLQLSAQPAHLRLRLLQRRARGARLAVERVEPRKPALLTDGWTGGRMDGLVGGCMGAWVSGWEWRSCVRVCHAHLALLRT